VGSEFTVEIAAGDGKPGRQVAGLAEMNRLFTAWVENVYHRRTHSETGMAPLARWMEGAPFPVPSAADLAEAFRWAEYRTVSKTGLVSLHGNRYQVDPSLVGQKVELVFDPLSLPCDKGSRGSPFNRSGHKILIMADRQTTASCTECSFSPLKWRALRGLMPTWESSRCSRVLAGGDCRRSG
jgi:hypothetical protein